MDGTPLLSNLVDGKSLLAEAALAVREDKRLAQAREPPSAVLPVARVVAVAQAVLDLGRLRHIENCVRRVCARVRACVSHPDREVHTTQHHNATQQSIDHKRLGRSREIATTAIGRTFLIFPNFQEEEH